MLRIGCLSFALCILSAGLLWGGTDVQVNQDPGPLLQNETSITTNPAVPGNLVVAYNEDPTGPGGFGNGIGISHSFDVGATWADTQCAEIWGVEADPSVDADLNGRIFAGFMSFRGFFTDTNGIYVAYSNDGGVTWSAPVPVDLFMNSPGNPGPFTDKCYLCVDNYPTSPNQNNVYITWQRDNLNGVNSDVYFSASYDGGLNFTAPQRISDLPPNVSECVGQVPKAAPNGDVYVVWGNFALQGHTTGYLFFDRSTDGGATWGTDVLIDSFLVVPRYPNPSVPSFYVRSYPTIGVSPQNANEVYVAVAADPDGVGGPDDGDIFLWASYDWGMNWTAPVRVNNDWSINDQFQPWLDVKEDGTIDIVWLDRAMDPNDQDFEVFIAYSNDGGQTFMLNAPVSDMIFPLLPEPNGWMGEYIGIDVDSNTAYIAWTDTRWGERDIFYDSIINPPLGIEERGVIDTQPLIVQCSPNPFCREARVEFSVPVSGPVRLKIYDVAGRFVYNLLEGNLEAGRHEIVWGGRTQSGRDAPTGIYLLKVEVGNQFDTKKLMLLR